MAWRHFVLVCAKLNSNQKNPKQQKTQTLRIKDFANHREDTGDRWGKIC